MKPSISLLALALTLSAANADVIVEQKIESPMQNGAITMKVKGENVRVDMASSPAGPLSTIINVATGDTITLMHSQKMAMKMIGAQTRQMMELMKKQMGNATPENAEVPQPKATGKTEKVGEYDAEIYTWTHNGVTQTLWVAKNFPNFDKLKPQLAKLNESAAGGMAKGMAPDIKALPGMVVKTQMEAGGQKITTTVVSVKEEPLDAALFEAPADYKEMGAPAMPPGVK